MANRFLIIILISIVSGCAHFEPKPILPEQTLLDFESRSLSNSGLQSFLQANNLATDTSPVLWNLDALTAAALYYHPDLDVARAQWGIEKAGTITAGERPNPTVGFSPEFNSSSPASITPWILGFNLDIPIETFGKRGYRIAQANNNSESARLEIASVAWQVRSHVRQSMIELCLAETMADLLKKKEAIQGDVVHLLALQLDAGAVSPSEVTQGRIALNTVTLSVIDAEKALRGAKISLAESLGVPQSALEGIDIVFDSLEDYSIQYGSPETLHRMILNRSDVLGLLAEYEADQCALQLEIAKQYPDVNIGPGYQLDQTDNKWSIGFSLTLPVFNQNQGAIAEAEAKRKETAARFLALQNRVFSQIDQAVAAYQYAVKKVEAANKIYQALQQQEQTTKRMYEVGEVSQLAVSATQLEANAGAIDQLEALGNAQLALNTLENVLQRPLHTQSPKWINPEPNFRDAQEKNK